MDIRLKNIIEIDKTVNKIKEQFKSYLKDQSISLEERWDSYNSYWRYLDPDETSEYEIGIFNLESIYDQPDRYSRYDYTEVIRKLEDELLLNGDDSYKITYHTFECCSEDLATIGIVYNPNEDVSIWNKQVVNYLNTIKEEILRRSRVSFYYDW